MSSFRQALIVTRPDPLNDYVNGVWTEVSPGTTIAIEASVQPADGNARRNVPEGYDQDSAYVLYTSTQLFAANRDKQQSDTVSLFGEDYVVVAVEPWQNNVINHYKVTVALPE